jgi:hypothetical protein
MAEEVLVPTVPVVFPEMAAEPDAGERPEGVAG